MLNLLKWNSLDFLHRYFWIFIIAAASLVLAAVVPNGEGFTNALLIFSSRRVGRRILSGLHRAGDVPVL